MEIRTFGGGGRIRACERTLARKTENTDGELLLLPIPTTRDKKYITGTDMPLSNILPYVRKGTFTVGYNMPEDFVREVISRGGRIYDAALDEDFLLENADITARGAVGYILTNTERDVKDLKFGIIGYGRIGTRLLRILLFLGAEVRVYTTRPELASELCEYGISAEGIGQNTSLEGIDFILNTAPAKLFSDECIADFLQKGKIIDLASGKYFEGFDSVIKLASVPDAMYPKTAGKIYAEHILKELGGGTL